MLCRMREQVLSEALRGPIALCFIVHGMFEHMNVKKRNSSANKSNERCTLIRFYAVETPKQTIDIVFHEVECV